MEQQPIPFSEVGAWFFDLDGTLMDTDDEAVEALARRLRFLGEARALDFARRVVMATETPANCLMTFLDMLGLDPLFFRVRKLLQRRVQPTFRIIEGVKPLLEYLASRVPLVVVSTRSREDAQAFLEQHELTELFQFSVTQESTKRLKPHPQPVLYAAQQLNLAPQACVLVGDTPVDVRSARNAGAWAIGVLCGFGENAELWQSGAHMVLPSTVDLLPLLKEAFAETE